MADLWVLFTIFAAVAAGFFLGRRPRLEAQLKSALPWSEKRYVEGLTYLLKDQSDEAIDSFVSDMAVNSETLEVHLALGALLRRKGELERSVKVHENLLDHPQLNADEHNLVQLELARDYVVSGLLDRAETLLVALVTHPSLENKKRRQALVALIDVYQDTHEWLKAIDVADCLTTQKFANEADQWRRAQSHYACELADQALRTKQTQEATRWIKTALRYDQSCVRASLLQAQIDAQAAKYPAAIAALTAIPKQNTLLAGEMIAPLVACYQGLGDSEALMRELQHYLEHYPDTQALMHLCELQEHVQGEGAVLAVLAQHLPKFPQKKAAQQLLADMRAHDIPLAKVRATLNTLLSSEVEYQCIACGFAGGQLHWMCPSCHSWGSIRKTELN